MAPFQNPESSTQNPVPRIDSHQHFWKYDTSRHGWINDEMEVLKRDFFNSLMAAFTPAEIRKQLKKGGLSGLAVETISDRHLLVFGRMR